jgi:PAS domain S-box-containing protein/diguanylate cyclase (GGDEF)-like protein
MPYLVCQHCGFRAYSAAIHSRVEECPICGNPLPRRAERRRGRGTPAVGPGDAGSGATSLSEVRAGIEREFGELPAFFEPAFANRDVLRALSLQTRLGWVESPVPAEFRIALLNALAERSPWPWRAVADEAHRLPRSVMSEPGAWPAQGETAYDELLELTVQFVVERPDETVRARLQTLLGWNRYASLIAVLTYLETCRTFAQSHVGLAAAARSRYEHGKAAPASPVVEVDRRGLIVSCSPAAESLFGRSAAALVGTHFRDLFADEQGHAFDRCIEKLRGHDQTAVSEHSFKLVGRRSDATSFSAVVTVTNRGRDGHPGKLSAVVESDTLRGRDASRSGYRLLMSMAEADLSLIRADHPLAGLARALGWEYMLVWRFDPRDGLLRCVAQHHLAAETRADLEDRTAATFSRGEGRVGSVFQTGVPEWQADVESSGSAVASGLWLPIGSPGEAGGVIELLSTNPKTPDPALLDVLSTIARKAGSDSLDSDAVAAADPRAGAHPPSGARLAFEAAPVGMALVSLEPGREGIITEANKAMAVLSGRDDESELVGTQIRDLTHPDDLTRDAHLEAQLQAGTIPSYEAEKRFQRADGEIFWGELTVSLIRADDETRRPLYVVVQLADITDRKQAEEALNANRERLASVFDEAPIGMALATLDNRWLQVNDALCQTFGYSEAELLGMRLTDLIVPDEVGMVARYLEQLYAGEVLGYHVETRAIRGDGEVIWIQLSVSLVHNYEGEPEYVLAEAQDISERKRLEEELEQGALLDAVTGLPSRALLFDRLEQARARSVRSGAIFAVMFVATSGVEDVRNRFGRERADAVLRELGSRLVAAVRAGDSVARYSDDEFVVICDDLRDREEASSIVERILEVSEFTISEGDFAVEIGVTLGMTLATSSDDSPGALVQRADAAVQRAHANHAKVSEDCGTF